MLGLSEPLPGLHRGRRARLWLGLPRADGRGADPCLDRPRRGRAFAQRIELLRAMRKRLPGAHPAAQDDAALARASICQRKVPATYRYGLGLWAWVARRPALYHAMVEMKA